MKYFAAFFPFFFFMHTYGHNSSWGSPVDLKKQIQIVQTKTIYTFKIIPLADGTWGYDIFKNEKKYIHQTNIPAMPGNIGFKNKADAKKVARLVIGKLKKGEMPPSVTIDEMKKLNVLLTN